MKLKTAILSILLSTLFSCRQEDVPSTAGTGYLSFSSMEVKPATITAISTRAVNPALAVEIEKEDGTAVIKYAAGATEVSKKIELEAGRYRLKAYSPNYGTVWDNTEKGEPVYYKEQPFSIEAEKVRYLTVDVPMTGIGVTLMLPENFDTWFRSYTFYAGIGERNVELKDGESAYFTLLPDGEPELHYSLAVVNMDGEHMDRTGTCQVTENRLYEVTYSLATRFLEFN